MGHQKLAEFLGPMALVAFGGLFVWGIGRSWLAVAASLAGLLITTLALTTGDAAGEASTYDELGRWF